MDSGAASMRMMAWAFGLADRAPPQNLPDVWVRIQTEPLPLGVKRMSDLWPVCELLVVSM